MTKCSAVWGVALAILAGSAPVRAWTPVFAPEVLHEATKKGIGLPPEEMIRAVHQELLKAYPGHILPEPKWRINVAGGAMGELAVLSCGLHEYLAFFGTPIGTEGFSGRYPKMEIWDFMMAGAQWTFREGDLERHEYGPGDFTYLARGEAKGYKVPDTGWMLEYGRGDVVTTFGFGIIAPTANVTKDWHTALGQIGDCIKAMKAQN